MAEDLAPDPLQAAYARRFAGATHQLVGLWLAYVRQPDPAALARFTQAQSALYLAQVFGLEGNYSRALNHLPVPHAR
jgi:hypothetical protein